MSNYTKTEKFYKANEAKIKNLDSTIENEKYWELFKAEKFPEDKQKGSMAQYKCSIFNFMEYINKDIALASVEEIESFIDSQENENTKKNKIAHIKAILTFIVTENLNDAVNRISEELLMYLIPVEYIGVFKAALKKNNIVYKIA